MTNPSPKPAFWIVDDIQQIIPVTEFSEENGKIKITSPKSHSGQIYSKEFCHPSQEEANKEIQDRHHRLNKALAAADLILCLSIQKEPSRKSRGAGKKDLEAFEKKDKENYKSWVENLKRKWEEINHEIPETKKIVKALRTAQMIQDAFKNPLAAEFIEIMAKEDLFKRKKEKYLEVPE